MTEKTVWVRGRPLRGFVFGLILGIGVFLLLTKFELIPIDTMTLGGTVLGGGVLGAIRALVGRPYRVSTAPDTREGAETPG